MNPEFKGADVIFTIDGKEVSQLQSFEIDAEPEINREREFKNGDNLILSNREFTVTMEDVEFRIMDKFFTYDNKFTVVGTGCKYPRGNKLPKKKRIRNKWKKKYEYTFELNDCVFV